MMSRRPPPILRHQPKKGKTGQTEGSLSRGGIKGPGAYRALTALTQLPRRPLFSERMSRGELYEYYKRIGMLEVYFTLFPGG